MSAIGRSYAFKSDKHLLAVVQQLLTLQAHSPNMLRDLAVWKHVLNTPVPSKAAVAEFAC